MKRIEPLPSKKLQRAISRRGSRLYSIISLLLSTQYAQNLEPLLRKNKRSKKRSFLSSRSDRGLLNLGRKPQCSENFESVGELL